MLQILLVAKPYDNKAMVFTIFFVNVADSMLDLSMQDERTILCNLICSIDVLCSKIIKLYIVYFIHKYITDAIYHLWKSQ